MQRSIAISLPAAVLFGLAVGLADYTFVYAQGCSYLTNNRAARVNCHVMQAQYDAWMKSSHHSVPACNDCHQYPRRKQIPGPSAYAVVLLAAAGTA